ncbi:hypothetical protein LTR08_006614 [Meristemomyces frigidus]|nr:hypothetical protein LTR08_006614 [Meristemomyces frigidus]
MAAAGTPGVFSHSVPNKSAAFIIVSIIFIIITTLFFAFRQGWRWAHRQRGWDDAMAAAAYIILVIQTVFGGVAAHYGFGKHRKDIMPTYTEALKFFFLYQICYKLLGGFTKLTFCFLYLRIFNQKPFKRLVITVASIVAAGSLAFAIATVFQCTPVHRAWDHRIPGHCTNNSAFWYSHAAFNTFWDIVIYIMPVPLIRSLKLRGGQKTGLVSIFALGAFVIVASIVRMVMLYASADTADPSWGSTVALTWTEIEANTSVIVCCMPALRVPFLNLWRNIQGGQGSTTPISSDRPTDQRYPGAYAGPHRNSAIVAHSIDKPQKSHQSRDYNSGLHGSEGTHASTLYDKMFSSLNTRKQGSQSRNSSQDELARGEAGLLPGMELGAIYKTTDVHITSQNVRRHPDKEVSFAQILRDDE